MKKHWKHKSSCTQRRIIADKRRQAKRATHQAERTRRRKLVNIAEEIRMGNFEGVKTSPLLAVNIGWVKAYLRKSSPQQSFLDALMG